MTLDFLFSQFFSAQQYLNLTPILKPILINYAFNLDFIISNKFRAPLSVFTFSLIMIKKLLVCLRENPLLTPSEDI